MEKHIDKEARSYGGLPLAITLTTSIQGLATVMMLALATLAPIVSSALEVSVESVGYQISVVYIAAAVVSSISGALVHRFGGSAISQAALLVGAAGCVGLVSGNLIITGFASLLIGVAYGMTNPAASQLLNRVTPERRRGIVFSIKQSGVPLGGAVAGVSLPALTVLFSWQGAILCVAGIALIVAVCMIPTRKHLDYDRDTTAKISGNLISGPIMVWNLPRLRALSIMGFCFSAVQLSLMSFMVILLVEDALWGLITAGVVASLVQVFGAIARVSWGMLADRTGHGMLVLAIVGTIICIACLGVAGLTPSWPDWLVIFTLSIFGVSAIGWNGVFMAEIVRSAPLGKVGEATGGALTFTFAGVVLGPSLYAAAHSFFPSHSATFLVLTVLPAIGVALLLKEMARS